MNKPGEREKSLLSVLHMYWSGETNQEREESYLILPIRVWGSIIHLLYIILLLRRRQKDAALTNAINCNHAVVLHCWQYVGAFNSSEDAHSREIKQIRKAFCFFFLIFCNFQTQGWHKYQRACLYTHINFNYNEFLIRRV